MLNMTFHRKKQSNLT